MRNNRSTKHSSRDYFGASVEHRKVRHKKTSNLGGLFASIKYAFSDFAYFIKRGFSRIGSIFNFTKFRKPKYNNKSSYRTNVHVVGKSSFKMVSVLGLFTHMASSISNMFATFGAFISRKRYHVAITVGVLALCTAAVIAAPHMDIGAWAQQNNADNTANADTVTAKTFAATTVNSTDVSTDASNVTASDTALTNVAAQISENVNEVFGPENGVVERIAMLPQVSSLDSEQLASRGDSLLSKPIDAYLVKLDGQPLFAVADQDAYNSVIAAIKAPYLNDPTLIKSEINESLTGEPGAVPISMFKSVTDALKILDAGHQVQNSYTVQDGDDLWTISRNLDMHMEDLLSYNNMENDLIFPGDVINYPAMASLITVKTYHNISESEEIPFTEERVNDDTLYEGKENTEIIGVVGESTVEYEVVKVNGVESSRKELNRTVKTEPVTQVVHVGTKPIPKGVGSGSFMVPTSGTYTSGYGYRWGAMHKGIDLANSSGTHIYAADDGIVTSAGNAGDGYGIKVVIDHQNGYKTLYGHMSRLGVSVGDVVEKGDLIGYMGTTGNSTGNHLHFEIFKNGSNVNPGPYIGY